MSLTASLSSLMSMWYSMLIIFLMVIQPMVLLVLLGEVGHLVLVTP